MANATNPSDFELKTKTLGRRSKPSVSPAQGTPRASQPKMEKPLAISDDLSSMLQS